MRIQVRRAKHRSDRRQGSDAPYNRTVRQRVSYGCRVYVYSNAQLARVNADQLAKTGRIGIFGLRGFHIESYGTP